MTPAPSRTELFQGALRVAGVYALFAGLWILLSDRVMGLMFRDPETLVQASMAKGWFFVAVTSLLLYVLVRRLIGRLDAAYARELAESKEKQRALKLLAAIANGSTDAIFAKDEQGRYLLVNDAAARVLGTSPAQLLGQDDRALFLPEQAATIMSTDQRVFASGQFETVERRMPTPQGERVFLIIKGPLRDAQGTTFGTFGISRDITERQLALEELARRNAELERFDRASTGRELRMIELKREVNQLAQALGREPPYDLHPLDASGPVA